MSYSRRQVIANLCAGLCLGGQRASYASEKPSLESDQGIVLCGWGSELASITAVEFREFHTRATFSFSRANPGETLAPSTTKLGRYYLHAYYSSFANVGKVAYQEPSDERATFEVLNGVVNYIGDWFVAQKGPRFAVHLATIVRAKNEYPWLEDYQLFVSMPGREALALSWGQVQESAGS